MRIVNRLTGYTADAALIETLCDADHARFIPAIRQFYWIDQSEIGCPLCGDESATGPHVYCIEYEHWLADRPIADDF